MIGTNSIQSRGLLKHRNFPVRVYPFGARFGALYGTTQGALKQVSDTLRMNDEVLRNPSSKLRNLFGIAFPWGEVSSGKFTRELELTVFAFDAPFGECNPELYTHTFENTVPTNRSNKYCETGVDILGREIELRRAIAERGGDLAEYLDTWPDLGNLGPIDKKAYNLEID